jgi:hypothetical protein
VSVCLPHMHTHVSAALIESSFPRLAYPPRRREGGRPLRGGVTPFSACNRGNAWALGRTSQCPTPVCGVSMTARRHRGHLSLPSVHRRIIAARHPASHQSHARTHISPVHGDYPRSPSLFRRWLVRAGKKSKINLELVGKSEIKF